MAESFDFHSYTAPVEKLINPQTGKPVDSIYLKVPKHYFSKLMLLKVLKADLKLLSHLGLKKAKNAVEDHGDEYWVAIPNLKWKFFLQKIGLLQNQIGKLFIYEYTPKGEDDPDPNYVTTVIPKAAVTDMDLFYYLTGVGLKPETFPKLVKGYWMVVFERTAWEAVKHIVPHVGELYTAVPGGVAATPSPASSTATVPAVATSTTVVTPAASSAAIAPDPTLAAPTTTTSSIKKWTSAGGVVIPNEKDHDHVYVILPSNHYGPWAFPKGRVDRGESVKQAAVREVWEETGLHVRILPGKNSYIGKGVGGFSITHFFLMVRTGGAPSKTDETEKVELVTWDKAKQLFKSMGNKRDQKIADKARAALKMYE